MVNRGANWFGRAFLYVYLPPWVPIMDSRTRICGRFPDRQLAKFINRPANITAVSAFAPALSEVMGNLKSYRERCPLACIQKLER